jgi:hypothetical protein
VISLCRPEAAPRPGPRLRIYPASITARGSGLKWLHRMRHNRLFARREKPEKRINELLRHLPKRY